MKEIRSYVTFVMIIKKPITAEINGISQNIKLT